MKINLNLTPEQFILLRSYVWNTKLQDGNHFHKAAFELAQKFDRLGYEKLINALIREYGEPHFDAEVDADGASFIIAE